MLELHSALLPGNSRVNEIINSFAPLFDIITCPGPCRQGHCSAVLKIIPKLHSAQCQARLHFVYGGRDYKGEIKWDHFPRRGRRTRTDAHTHARTCACSLTNLILWRGRCLKRLFSLMRDTSLTCVSEHSAGTITETLIPSIHCIYPCITSIPVTYGGWDKSRRAGVESGPRRARRQARNSGEWSYNEAQRVTNLAHRS